MAPSTPRLILVITLALSALCALAFAATEAFTKQETRVQTLGAGVAQVVLHADAGNVRLVGSTEPRVTVRSESRWLFRKPKVTAARHGETLVLRGDCPAQALRERCGADFTVEVPFNIVMQFTPEGLVSEYAAYYDQYTLLQQLGHVPAG